MTHTPATSPRVPAIDIARTVALVGMAIYHFAFDLEMFGWLAPGSALSQPLRGLAVVVASSFLALAGLSLVLAHGHGIRWRGFWRRLAMVAGGAVLVSVTSVFWAPPGAFVYFGILHAIAASSLLGLMCLRLPVWALLVLGAAVFWAPEMWSHPAFNPRALAWTGLAANATPSVDFEPILPWFAAFLFGMALGRVGQAAGLWARLSGPPGRLARVFGWPGRHSLAIYLIHQPVLIGLIAGATVMLR